MSKFLPILLLFPLALAGVVPPQPGGRDSQWKKVDEAMNNGLPKTAIEQLQPIIDGALAEKKYAEAIKAIGRKIALEGNIQGNKPEERITRLQAEIEKAPTAMKPVMQAILANWCWHYFQQNRWRFLQRTQTSEPPGEDFTTWDLARLFAEIDKHFTNALSAKPALQKTPIAEYDQLLDKGTMPDAYRPTLYDFLAHEALEFYSAGEQAGARREDAFDLPADSPAFAPADEFLNWTIQTSDEQSPTVKALRLYQDLLRLHRNDDDRTALLDVDLLRLNFAYNKAVGEEKDARYKAALKRLADQCPDHEVSAHALYCLASAVMPSGELLEAHRIATEGRNRFPDSVGGKQCYNLIQQIEAKSVQITTERVWSEPRPTIDLYYKNLTRAYFRVVEYDWLERLQRGNRRPESLDANDRRVMLAKRPVLAWSVDLPATKDYQERVEQIPAPEDLKPGSYFLLASHDPRFGESDNLVSFTDFWKSDLALVIRQRGEQEVIEGFVLDARSGQPIAGAQVRAWREDRNQRLPAGAASSDANGLFRIRGADRRGHLIHVQHDGQQLAAGGSYYLRSQRRRPEPNTLTVFFTDRSLYRPGQTIQYKGLCIRSDQQSDTYEVIAGQSLTVVFSDPNGKEITRQTQRSNDFGSLSGSFTAPRDRLMGRMSLQVQDGPRGEAGFNVEEYKRPKFQAAIDPPKEAAKLGAEVHLQGKATAYTGAAIDGAKVRWRVVRQVRYPVWWYWRFWWIPPRPEEQQEIAHGSAVTGSDGAFDIRFTAKPDLSASEKDEPTFGFTIHADVTDAAGETRSAAKTINLGYTALQASLSAGDWQTGGKPVEISIRTATLDGEGQQAEGSLKIYRLKQPKQVARPRLPDAPYPIVRRGGEGEAPQPDPANPDSWPLGDMAADVGFTTDAAGNARQEFSLRAGPYRALLETRDRYGKPVTARLPIRVLDPDAAKPAIRVPDLLAAPEWSLEPGQEFMALWGSGYDRRGRSWRSSSEARSCKATGPTPAVRKCKSSSRSRRPCGAALPCASPWSARIGRSCTRNKSTCPGQTRT